MTYRLLLLCFLSVLFSLVTTSAHATGLLDIKTVKSGKQITAWLVEDHTVPVISMQFLFRGAGAVNDPEGKEGLSQLLSNTLDEGAGDLDSKAFQAALNDHSISLSFSSSRDDFGGSLKTLDKYQDRAFDLLHLALTKPHFGDDALRRMKDSNMERIRSNMTDPDWMAARLSNAVLFEGHPYARNSGGTLSSLPRITATDLRNKLGTELGRDRLMIAVAGNITPEELSVVLDKVFGDLPESSTVKTVDPVSFKEQGERVQLVRDIPQTVLKLAYPGLPMSDPDYPAAEIFNYILGGAGFGSRLTENIREQRGLTYGIFSDLSEMKSAALFTIETSTRAEKVPEMLSLIGEDIRKISETPVTATELAQAKSFLTGSVPLGLTSTDRIAGVMIGFQIFGLPPTYLDEREKRLREVTLEDVKRAAERILKNDSATTILVGQPLASAPSGIRTVADLPGVE